MPSEGDDARAQTFFQYGNDAALKGNFDYAIDMYRQSCKIKPDNLVFRQALRGIERRKFNNDPAKVSRLVGAKNQPIRLKARAVKAKGNFAQAIEICEDAFVHNPWDVGASRDAAECAEHLGYHGLAQWLLESVQAQANDADFFRYAAHVHKLNESWQKAIQAWERVKKLDPNDEAAAREINALSAAATIKRSGLGEAIDKHDAPANPVAAEMEEMKASRQTPEERMLKEIQDDPTRVFSYLQLSEQYKMRGQLEEAEKLLSRGLKANPGQADLELEHAEIQMSRIKAAIDKCNQRLKARPDDPVAKPKLDELTKLLNDYEVKEFKRRVKHSPDDHKLQLELGIRLARVGHHDEAIAAFQQARNGTAQKVQACLQMGLSFEAKGALKLAERSLQDALKAVDGTDTNTTNAIHYRLGRVYEGLENDQMAEEHYNEVAANDYTYLDVAERLRNLGS